MAAFSFEFRGVNRLANGYRAMAARMPTITDAAMGEWAQETRGALKATPYPPPPAPKKGRKVYVRTGRLANSWFAARMELARWQIGNRAQAKSRTYASYVIGDGEGRQAYMHVGRWWKAIDKINERVPKLRQRIEGRITNALSGYGVL